MVPNEISTLGVKHNIEVAHRLSELEGKCLQIHGHSMWVKLELVGELDAHGILEGIAFGDLKQSFRHYLDTEYDHRLLLNVNDEYAKLPHGLVLPGLNVCPGDPTTENIAKWIGEWACDQIGKAVIIPQLKVVVHETRVNFATWEWSQV